jgi:uncharacterized protein YbaR (Trm112 family)
VLKNIAKLKALYDKGENIIEYVNNSSTEELDSSLAIAVSYDLQAGSYIIKAKENPDFENERALIYSNIINQLGSFSTVLEAGVGEATTLRNVLPKLNNETAYAGFDISYSRIKYAKSFLNNQGMSSSNLYVGDLFHAPFEENSFDVVYSSHTLEPNGGREKEALKELYRIANKYIVLFEPIYELANDSAKKHMDNYGYVKNLYSYAVELGYNVTEYKLIFSDNPRSNNNTGVMIIEKSDSISNAHTTDIKLACPVTKMPLEKIRGSYFCRESMLLYPIMDGIPCLLASSAIIATHYLEDI